MIDDLEEQISVQQFDPLGSPGGQQLASLERPEHFQQHLAHLPGHEDLELLKHLSKIRSDRYWNAAFESSQSLFSIVLGQYRPAALMDSNNSVDVSLLTQRISLSRPETWASWMGEWNVKLTRTGELCFRADTEAEEHVGSGFVSSGGESYTAGHVIRKDGWLFGELPKRRTTRAILDYGCFGSGKLPDRRHYATDFALGPEIIDIGLLKQDLSAVLESVWMKNDGTSAILTGLNLVRFNPGKDYLRNRKVGVIGHPADGNFNGRPGDIELVYPDGIPSVKRFMPGLLNHEPIVYDDFGIPYLVHDCSTLAGASGGPLIDLQTGDVLGIHVGGNGLTGNRAVPAWIVLEYLDQLQWTS